MLKVIRDFLKRDKRGFSDEELKEQQKIADIILLGCFFMSGFCCFVELMVGLLVPKLLKVTATVVIAVIIVMAIGAFIGLNISTRIQGELKSREESRGGFF